MTIIWTERADEELAANLDYLEQKWGMASAQRFYMRLKAALNSIVKNPEMYPTYDAVMNIRKCVVVRQITLYFMVDNSSIYVLSVFNNWQDPDRLTFG